MPNIDIYIESHPACENAYEKWNKNVLLYRLVMKG